MDPSFRQELGTLVASMVAQQMAAFMKSSSQPTAHTPAHTTTPQTPVIPGTPQAQLHRTFSGSSHLTPALTQPSRSAKRTLDMVSGPQDQSPDIVPASHQKKRSRKNKKSKKKKDRRLARDRRLAKKNRPRKQKRLRSPKQKSAVKKRKPSDPQLHGDKKVVNKPVMELLDNRFLAPVVSPLFPKVYLKGKQVHKKNREMNLRMYKSLTRDLLRLLTRANLSDEMKKNPRMTFEKLKARYRKAMFVLVKKRRANHVQSWRRWGTHCPLIYTPSGLFVHAQMNGFPDRNPVVRRETRQTTEEGAAVQRQTHEGEAQHQTDEGESQHQTDEGEVQRQTDEDESQHQTDEDESQHQTDEDESQHQTDEDETTAPHSNDFFNFSSDEDDFTSEDDAGEAQRQTDAGEAQHQTDAGETQRQTDAGETQRQTDAGEAQRQTDAGEVQRQTDAGEAQHQIVNRPPVTLHSSKAKCVGCGEMIEGNSAYPPDSDKGWSKNTSLRCEKCWDKHVDDNLLPKIAVQKQREKKARQVAANKRRREKDVGKNLPKQKKKKTRKPCRCGSWEHQTVRHSKCPLNKKNQSANPVPVPVVNPMPTPVANPAPTTVANPAPAPVINPVSNPVANPPVPNPVVNPVSTTVDDPVPVPVVNAASTPVINSVTVPVANPVSGPVVNAVSGPVANPVFTPKFSVGQNVLAKWTKTETLLAQIKEIKSDLQYLIYFFNGQCKVVDENDIKPESASWSTPTRAEMLGKHFFCDGEFGEESIAPGKWCVRRIEGDTFVCTRLTGGSGSDNVDKFDIAYVTKEFVYQKKKQQERLWEMGPILGSQ